MGNCPPSAPDPDTTNRCNDYHVDEKDDYHLPGFCTDELFAGRREEWCEKLGSEGEWEASLSLTRGGACYYDTCKPYVVRPTGCCAACCPFPGIGNACIRKNFNGDPIKCCLQDKVCTAPGNNAAPPSCFSDPEKKDTCAPCQRDITSTYFDNPDGSKFSCREAKVTPCQDLLLPYCSGEDLPRYDISWFDRWNGENSCMKALKRNLFNVPGIGCAANDIPLTNSAGLCQPINVPISEQGAEWSRKLMSKVLERYAYDGFVLGTNPGDVGYSSFQDMLYVVSCAAPIIMQDGLRKTCSIYNAEQVSRNPTIANFCGCYLRDEEYTQYVDLYQVNKECTPTCNRLTSIPTITGDNQPIRCNQTVCIIDDISINLISSNIGQSGVGISQVCGNCSGNQMGETGSCTCVINSDVISVVNSGIGGINISQQCTSSICKIPNPDPFGEPKSVDVPCSEVPTTTFQDEVNKLENGLLSEREKKALTILFGFLLLLGFLFILFLILNKRK